VHQVHLTQVEQPITPTAPAMVKLTQEELEFNEQFQKWEREFDQWKKANVNHPDKVAYKSYEDQFEQVRKQLLKVTSNLTNNFVPNSVNLFFSIDGEILKTLTQN
jgi:predicted acetyltransferase